ncbi:peroxiredoxin-like family protein [Sandarakinorhabdus rubra]|uniref:peroxiredoxin-like family protein n=1 Tax=Sandarakinorhabdus rubra TaxID=2672568 RepID=UPI0013DB71E1|nr:peroxiredoxin-like family protein [Sandarakinorhabdus rubra]
MLRRFIADAYALHESSALFTVMRASLWAGMNLRDPSSRLPGRQSPVPWPTAEPVDPVWHARADRLVARLRRVGAGRLAPVAGQQFPDLVLPDATGRLTSLSELCRDGPIVLSVHRGLWCPWCRAELESWQAALPLLAESGCRLVVVTPETNGRAAAMAALVGRQAQVLCDVDFGASAALGLAHFLGVDLVAEYARDGLDLAEHYGAASGVLPIPATFVIEVGMRVRFAHVDVDFRRRADPAQVIASLRF